jgi:hypothetical protein
MVDLIKIFEEDRGWVKGHGELLRRERMVVAEVQRVIMQRG